MSVAAPSSIPLPDGVSKDSIEEELTRIASSKNFAAAPQATGLLRFVVRYSLENGGHGPKESTLGVEYFHIRDFDPKIHTNVRRTASDLRKRLKDYYDSEGRDDRIWIDLPPGGYRPAIQVHRKVLPPPDGWKGSFARFIRKHWYLAAGSAILLLAVFAVVIFLRAEQSVAILQFTDTKGRVLSDPVDLGLMGDIVGRITELGRYKRSLFVISAADVLDNDKPIRTPRDARRILGVDLVITATVEQTGDQMRISIHLTNAETGAEIRAADVAAPSENRMLLSEHLVRTIANLLEITLQPKEEAVLLSSYKTKPEAHQKYLLGLGYLDQNRLDDAASAFDGAILFDPGYAPAYAGNAEVWLGKYRMERQPGWLSLALASCGQALKLDPQLTPARIMLGRIHSARGESAEAVKVYQSVLEMDPLSTDAHRGMARVFEKAGDRKQAEKEYQAAIESRPGYWRGYDDLGAFYYRHHSYSKSLEQLLRARDLAPKNPSVQANLGGIYLQLGNWPQAETALRASLALRTNATAYNNLAVLLFFQKRYAETALAMEKAVAQEPRSVSFVGGLEHAYKWTPGKVEQCEDARRRAIALAEEQLRARAAGPVTRAELARLLADVPNKDRARTEIEKALQQAPKDQYVLIRAVVVYELIGDRNQAFKHVRQVLEAAGSVPEEVKQFPELADLREDPQYKRAVSTLGK